MKSWEVEYYVGYCLGDAQMWDTHIVTVAAESEDDATEFANSRIVEELAGAFTETVAFYGIMHVRLEDEEE